MKTSVDNGKDTFFDIARARALKSNGHASRPVFTYLNDGENVSGELTFAQLDHQAKKLAAHLQKITKPGDRVLLVYPPSLDYIISFYGCLYAGVIAVPALSPANANALRRLSAIADDCKPVVALTHAGIAENVAKMEFSDNNKQLESLIWFATDDLEDLSEYWIPPTLCGSDIIFLQYTSGSTSSPKGVMVSHDNLLANLALITESCNASAGDKVVFWLPPYHDFGLVCGIAWPIFFAGHCIQFPPSVFLMRPIRWLKLVSRYRARVTGAPNFAYQLCAEQISEAQKSELDLSCLDLALNGAERVRVSTLRHFCEAFAGQGFRPEAIAPAYGLAESVLLVAMRSRAASGFPAVENISKAALAVGWIATSNDSLDTTPVICLGETRRGNHHVAVVDPKALRELPEVSVGEIWVSGGSVAQGYWGQPTSVCDETFGARIEGSDRGWLRTGDTGFIRNGELYVIGRIKEMMIINGRNVYPQDVEVTIEGIDPAFRANGCAVFALEDEANSPVVIVQEVNSRQKVAHETLIGKVRKELAQQHGIFDLAAVLLVKPGRLPRTSSGKIQRIQCKQMYITQTIDANWSWRASFEQDAISLSPYEAPQGEIEQTLARFWSELLDVERVGRNNNFFELGGDSLLAARLLARVHSKWSVSVPLATLFSESSLGALAVVVSSLPPTKHSAIQPADRSRPLPLSLSQQRLWFLNQLDASLLAAYHMPVVLDLQGPVRFDVVQKTLADIVTRHESLRTTFVASGEEVFQVVAQSVQDFVLAQNDLSEMTQCAQHESVTDWANYEASKPFDLSGGRLIRARLLRLAHDKHVLLVTFHHMVADGWSVGVFVREFSALYAACNEGRSAPLPPMTIQYPDYAVWQRKWLQQEHLQQQAEYWKEQLADAPALLALPTDRARPTRQSVAGASVEVVLDKELTHALKQLSQHDGVTLFMTLLAGWSAVLSRLAGQEDVIIGTPTAYRPRQELEALIGFFVNSLALRINVSGATRLDELISQVRRVTLQAQENQDLPFEKVVEIVQPARNLGHTPLFQVMLTWQNNDLKAPDIPGVHLNLRGSPINAVKCDLELILAESNDTIVGEFAYSTALFDAETIERHRDALICMLRAMISDPTQVVSSVEIISSTERALLLETWNQTDASYSSESCLHQLFEAQVNRTPDAVALVQDGCELTYSQLNVQANRLAHYLIAQGVRPDSRVGVCAERRPHMVVALLATLKAGGAYVPLDPDYPTERLLDLLLDANPTVLLMDESGDKALGESVERLLPSLCVQHLPSALANLSECDSNPDSGVSGVNSRHLAYVIYTSGSTGKPKGVMVEHRSIVNRLEWMQDAFSLTEKDVVLQKTPFSFDVSVWEFFWTLLYGAKLVLAVPGAHKDPRALIDLIQQQNVTILHFVPSMLSAFVSDDFAMDCRSLRYVFASGEALPSYMVRKHQELLPDARIVNLYGPTEASVDVTAWICPEGFNDIAVPMGRPISNTRLYVLDGHYQLVPIGSVGELFIGGVGVARGYLNRPELTAERFLNDPFSQKEGALLYRTGDLVRYQADGNLEFLGRNDYQVKVRGFRIELGEIEAQLIQHASVQEAVVIARGENDFQQLVAYVVLNPEASVETPALRDYLSRQLPDYMVPSAFVQMPQLPLTPNGKLNRKALPAPGVEAVVTRVYEAPLDELEHTLATIWAELLGVVDVGRRDNFFELGGHSLLAIQVTTRLRSSLGRDVPLTTLFNAPVLCEFAREIKCTQRYADDQQLLDLDAFMSSIEEKA
ncbi:amino acid adenylation domain-containing protein [Pseudomonas sp.]|uniref:amino acid adenylation domain-containing protein n=1 Tax=Pseudomonas sp. TaxID=306 RepID=UPI003BB6CB0E